MKVRTGITVVGVPAQIRKSILFGIGFQNPLLVGNGIALALQLVLMGQSWVKGGNELLGAVLGNVVFLYQRALPLGNPGLAVYGSFSGIFLGSWVVALGEVVNIYAILIRRIGLVKGIGLVILSMALGKVVGSLWFFFF